MEVRLTLYGPLRGVTGEKRVDLSVDGPADDSRASTGEGVTLGDVVRQFVEQYPRARDQLLTEEGAVRPSVRLLRDGEKGALSDAVTGDESISLFPAMRGG